MKAKLVKESLDEGALDYFKGSKQYSYIFSNPIIVRTVFSDELLWDMLSSCNGNTREITEKTGIDLGWVESDYESWKRDKKDEEIENGASEEEINDDKYSWNDFYESEEFPSQEIQNSLNDDDNTLSLGDTDNPEAIYETIANDFNESELEQYFDEAKEFGVTSIRVIDNPDWYDKNSNQEDRLIIEVKTNKKLDESEIKLVKDYITGQCSDGWGEGFEQQDINPNGNMGTRRRGGHRELFNYNISTWSRLKEGRSGGYMKPIYLLAEGPTKEIESKFKKDIKTIQNVVPNIKTDIKNKLSGIKGNIKSTLINKIHKW